jgi:hypothetical protein
VSAAEAELTPHLGLPEDPVHADRGALTTLADLIASFGSVSRGFTFALVRAVLVGSLRDDLRPCRPSSTSRCAVSVAPANRTPRAERDSGLGGRVGGALRQRIS